MKFQVFHWLPRASTPPPHSTCSTPVPLPWSSCSSLFPQHGVLASIGLLTWLRYDELGSRLSSELAVGQTLQITHLHSPRVKHNAWYKQVITLNSSHVEPFHHRRVLLDKFYRTQWFPTGGKFLLHQWGPSYTLNDKWQLARGISHSCDYQCFILN